MYKYQRKHYANPEKLTGHDDIRDNSLPDKSSLCDEIAVVEEVFPPRSKRQIILDKPLLNRCCWISPELHSFSQLTGDCTPTPDPSTQDTTENDFPRYPHTEINSVHKLKYDMRKVIYVSEVKHNERKRIKYDGSFGSQSQNADNTEHCDRPAIEGPAQNKVTLTQYHSLPKNFYISDNPQVKTIAEMYRIYKKNDMELRKLEERVVCFEYNVLDRDRRIAVQKMRVFFSTNPGAKDEENILKEITRIFNISATDVHKLNQKEVQIIDENIYENRSYLEDLRRILRRKQQTSATQDRRALNLRGLYETAKRELLESNTDCDANVLSKEEMEEIEKLILVHCKSSVHGIRKKTLEHTKSSDNNNFRDSISRSLIKEVMKGEWNILD